LALKLRQSPVSSKGTSSVAEQTNMILEPRHGLPEQLIEVLMEPAAFVLQVGMRGVSGLKINHAYSKFRTSALN
jgi:hypothetical protein